MTDIDSLETNRRAAIRVSVEPKGHSQFHHGNTMSQMSYASKARARQRVSRETKPTVMQPAILDCKMITAGNDDISIQQQQRDSIRTHESKQQKITQKFYN